MIFTFLNGKLSPKLKAYNMNHQIKIPIFGHEITLQIRKAGAKTRAFDPIVIDESKKAESLAAIDLDNLAQKAAAMRAKRAAAQG